MRYLFFLTTLYYFPLCLQASSFISKDGFVPDKTTAIKIAEAVMIPVYGEQVLKQKPFKVIKKKDRWVIDGTFHCPANKSCKGGVVHVEINKETAEIMRMTHGR